MGEKMDISVIVPIYHGKKYIESIISQIESCKQKLGNNFSVQLLLINDAPDEPIEEQYPSKEIEVVSVNTDCNRGIHGARVRGLEYSRGDFVLFLDQDDRIEPDYLHSQLEKIGDADAVICKAIHEKKQWYDVTMPFENVVSMEYMITQRNAIVSPGQVLLRRAAIPKSWTENILKQNGADDWFLWICMMSEKRVFVMNPEVLYEHVVDGQNTSWQSQKMQCSEQEILEIIENKHILCDEDIALLKRAMQKISLRRIQLMDKFKRMFFIYDAWMNLNNSGASISQYILKKQYEKVAIYGDGYLGKQLYRELRRNGIDVCYFVDRNAPYLKEEIPVYTPVYSLPKVDVVIITLVQGEKEVKELLEETLSAKYYSIEELIQKAIL